MSQPPSKPHGKTGPGGGWSARSNVSGQYRPPSPFSPTGSPHPQRVHHAHPTSPLTYTGTRHPMSPVPIGMPISPGISPVFGSPTGYIQCPRPRWPSPIPVATQAPRPFIPTQSSAESGATSPLASGPPEYMIGTYKPGDYEYVGVPLDHSQTEEESSGPSTAEIIANQSQDYVDEKLAEYQATIQQLQKANKNYHIFLRGQSSSQNKIFPVARINIAIFNIQRENSEALFVLIEVAWAGRKEPNRRRTDNKNNDHVKKRNGGERARSRSPSVLRPPKLIKSLRHCTMAN